MRANSSLMFLEINTKAIINILQSDSQSNSQTDSKAVNYTVRQREIISKTGNR